MRAGRVSRVRGWGVMHYVMRLTLNHDVYLSDTSCMTRDIMRAKWYQHFGRMHKPLPDKNWEWAPLHPTSFGGGAA